MKKTSSHFLLYVTDNCYIRLHAKARMNGESMAPTIVPGEIVVIDYNAYKKVLPERWDVVAYFNQTEKSMYTHRLVGLPGEEIDIHDSSIFN